MDRCPPGPGCGDVFASAEGRVKELKMLSLARNRFLPQVQFFMAVVRRIAVRQKRRCDRDVRLCFQSGPAST